MTYAFTAAQAETVKLWSTKDTRDALKAQFWYPMIYGADGNKAGMQEASKFKGIVRMVTEFEAKTGDRVTFPHMPRITGDAIENDTQLRGSGSTMSIQSQNVFYTYFAKQVISAGPLSDARALIKFLDAARPGLRDWFSIYVEECITAMAFGLTSWNNSLTLLGTSKSAVWLNTINTFDSSHIMYAGDATSDATIDSADVLTAQVLTKASTAIREDLSIPLEPIMYGGQERYLLLVSGRGKEQLLYDPDFRESYTRVIKDANNPLTERVTMEFDKFLIVEYPKCLNPAANVGRALILGANSLFFAKVKDMNYFQDPADDAKLKTALSITAAAGVSQNYHDSARYNAYAIDHYVRT